MLTIFSMPIKRSMELLAHEICHSLNHYNQQNHGIPRPSCGHAGHDDASHFGWDLRKELDAIKLGNSQKESNEVNSGSEKEKPQSQGELNKVEHTGSKEEQSKIEESQQDSSNLLPNVIRLTTLLVPFHHSFHGYLALKRKNNLLSNLMDDNLSLLKFDVSELDHGVGITRQTIITIITHLMI